MRPFKFGAKLVVVAGVAAVASTVAMTVPAAASAPRPHVQTGGPGHWSQVTSNGSGAQQDIGLARGSDGVLHVIWTSNLPARSHAITDTPISPNGSVGHAVTVAAGIEAPFGPGATVTAHGLDAFWNNGAGPGGTFEYTHPLKGGHWSFGADVAPLPGDTLYNSSAAVATGSDGKPWFAYSGFVTVTGRNALTVLHFGHSQREILSTGACCALDPAFGVDGRSGATWIAYQSLVPNREGIFAQRLASTGAPVDPNIFVPGSALRTSILPINERVAITGRGHGQRGVYVAYAAFSGPFIVDVDLIRLGTKKPTRLFAMPPPHTGQIVGVGLSANPSGALWVSWIEGQGVRPALFVRQSSNSVSKFGRTEKIKLPSGTSRVLEVYTSAQKSRLDILVLLTRNKETAYWATQVR